MTHIFLYRFLARVLFQILFNLFFAVLKSKRELYTTWPLEGFCPCSGSERQCTNANLVPPQRGRGQPGEVGRGRSAATTDSPSAAKDYFTPKTGECQLSWKWCLGGNIICVIVINKDRTPTGGSRYSTGDWKKRVPLVAGSS